MRKVKSIQFLATKNMRMVDLDFIFTYAHNDMSNWSYETTEQSDCSINCFGLICIAAIWAVESQ